MIKSIPSIFKNDRPWANVSRRSFKKIHGRDSIFLTIESIYQSQKKTIDSIEKSMIKFPTLDHWLCSVYDRKKRISEWQVKLQYSSMQIWYTHNFRSGAGRNILLTPSRILNKLNKFLKHKEQNKKARFDTLYYIITP